MIDGPAGNDGSIRPNQILAVSLPHSPLAPDQQKRIVALCGDRLLTSYGLRSLAAGDPDYKPHYTGDPWHRDGAYHQGTVWAWLLGHYALAEYRVHGDAELALQRLAAMRDHLFDAGLGTISEIFEAEPPHLAGGRPRRPGRWPASSRRGGGSHMLHETDAGTQAERPADPEETGGEPDEPQPDLRRHRFLLQPAWTTAVFWLLMLGSIAIAVHVFRHDPGASARSSMSATGCFAC